MWSSLLLLTFVHLNTKSKKLQFRTGTHIACLHVHFWETALLGIFWEVVLLLALFRSSLHAHFKNSVTYEMKET